MIAIADQAISTRNSLKTGPTRASRALQFIRSKRLGTPLLATLSLLALYLWLNTLELDSIEQRTINSDYLVNRITEHLQLTLAASAIVAVIAIPAGILLSRTKSRVAHGIILGLANIGQAAPAIGILVLLTIIFSTGFNIALVGLVAYSILPILRNTMVGIEQVDARIVESARGVGMTSRQVLFRIQLPLAMPVILAGLRTTLVFAVGVASLATFVNAGGLGDIIVNGIKLQRMPVLLTGSVITACIALFIDWIASLVEDLLRPKGM